VLVHDPETGATLAIDAPEEAAMMAALTETGWQLTDIFITHHHGDHVEGVAALKAAFKPRIVGPRAEADKIADLDVLVAEGDSLSFAGKLVEIIDTPGHTLGHIAYVIRSEPVAFVGDTLFALGCGRIIEGTPEQMWTSLVKLANLPPETKIYCGHEYTLANGQFAMSVDQDNAHLLQRMAHVRDLRAADKATLPTTIAEGDGAGGQGRARDARRQRSRGLHQASANEERLQGLKGGRGHRSHERLRSVGERYHCLARHAAASRRRLVRGDLSRSRRC
jgi:hydroxyacylglutathione hydrolase